MYICKQCGRENEDSYKFCLGCGANLEQQRADEGSAAEDAEMKSCPNCNADVAEGQRFCGHCGFNLDQAEEVPAEAEAKAPVESTASGDVVAHLIKVNPDGSPGDSVDLLGGKNVVGRSSDDAVLSGDKYLSPQHASIEIEGNQATIADLDSLNGVYYRITEITELQHGDFVRVGQEVLRFQLLDLAETIVEPAADGTIVAGSSPAGAWGSLERISAPDEASFTFLLRGSEQVIGRERGDILFRDDGYVSGRHCRIFSDSGRYFVEDLKSSNGTFIRIRGERTLPGGSLVLMGEQPFRIQIS